MEAYKHVKTGNVFTRDELVDMAIDARLKENVIKPTDNPNEYLGPDKKIYTRDQLGELAIQKRLNQNVISDVSAQQGLVGAIRGSGLQGIIRPITQLASTIVPSAIKPAYSTDAVDRSSEVAQDVADVAGLVAAPFSAVPGAVGGGILAGTGLDQPVGEALSGVGSDISKSTSGIEVEALNKAKENARMFNDLLKQAIKNKDFNAVKQYAKKYRESMRDLGIKERNIGVIDAAVRTAVEAAPSIIGAVPMVKGTRSRGDIPETKEFVQATEKGVGSDILQPVVDKQISRLEMNLADAGGNIPRGSTSRGTTKPISGEYIYPYKKIGHEDIPLQPGVPGAFLPTASVTDFLKKFDTDINKFKSGKFDRADIDSMLNDIGELKATTAEVVSKKPMLRTPGFVSGMESLAQAESTLRWLRDAKVDAALKSDILSDLASKMSKNVLKPVTDFLTSESAKTSLLSDTPVIGKSTNLERAALIAGLKTPRELMTEDRFLEEFIAGFDQPKK